MATFNEFDVKITRELLSNLDHQYQRPKSLEYDLKVSGWRQELERERRVVALVEQCLGMFKDNADAEAFQTYLRSPRLYRQVLQEVVAQSI